MLLLVSLAVTGCEPERSYGRQLSAKGCTAILADSPASEESAIRIAPEIDLLLASPAEADRTCVRPAQNTPSCEESSERCELSFADLEPEARLTFAVINAGIVGASLFSIELSGTCAFSLDQTGFSSPYPEEPAWLSSETGYEFHLDLAGAPEPCSSALTVYTDGVTGAENDGVLETQITILGET